MSCAAWWSFALFEFASAESGQIDFVEFCKHMKSKYKSPGDKEEEIKQAFKVFDADNNNFISADELKHLMQTLGDPLTDEEALEMIRVADVNQDGKIDYDGKWMRGLRTS